MPNTPAKQHFNNTAGTAPAGVVNSVVTPARNPRAGELGRFVVALIIFIAGLVVGLFVK